MYLRGFVVKKPTLFRPTQFPPLMS